MNSIDNHKTKNKPIQTMLTSLRPRLLSMAVASCLASMSAMVVIPEAQASDIEIYQGGSGGKPTVILMLDSSNSMNEDNKSSELIKGVMALINDENMKNKINIGIGSFPARTYDGKISVAAKTLDENQKKAILSELRKLNVRGQTPAPQAYAEAAAYMMGTKTYKNRESDEYSGFVRSSGDVKEKYSFFYKKPQFSSCGGQAIYFLTDGEPNYSSFSAASAVMDEALTSRSGEAKLSVNCGSGSDDGTGWPCMLDFVDKLLDKSNPANTSIKTATVGFGSEFNSIKKATSLKDCEKSTDDNAKNLCKLGIKGQGGFYYADDSNGIVRSLQSLIGKLGGDIQPVSTGSISVPLDSLGNFQSRNFAYLPILDPKPGDNNLWSGNLKKYKVVNATIKGANNQFVLALLHNPLNLITYRA